jgi:hypothetical protein
MVAIDRELHLQPRNRSNLDNFYEPKALFCSVKLGQQR